jgi:type I restriction enzyme S subunit
LPKYIFYVFESINWRDHNEAGGVPSLSKTNIYKIEILIPPTIQEQQKIASCLSSLDALITAQAEKIAQLKLHKKGLMQGLFPKIND